MAAETVEAAQAEAARIKQNMEVMSDMKAQMDETKLELEKLKKEKEDRTTSEHHASTSYSCAQRRDERL